MAEGCAISFTSNIPQIKKELAKVQVERMQKAVSEVRNTTLETLSGSRTGRTYFVPGTHRTYIASSPGEPPAQATGRLRQSITTQVEDNGKVGYVGTPLEYGKCLEFGTKNMAARPWLKPSFEKSEGKLKQIFGAQWLH